MPVAPAASGCVELAVDPRKYRNLVAVHADILHKNAEVRIALLQSDHVGDRRQAVDERGRNLVARVERIVIEHERQVNLRRYGLIVCEQRHLQIPESNRAL